VQHVQHHHVPILLYIYTNVPKILRIASTCCLATRRVVEYQRPGKAANLGHPRVTHHALHELWLSLWLLPHLRHIRQHTFFLPMYLCFFILKLSACDPLSCLLTYWFVLSIPAEIVFDFRIYNFGPASCSPHGKTIPVRQCLSTKLQPFFSFTAYALLQYQHAPLLLSFDICCYALPQHTLVSLRLAVFPKAVPPHAVERRENENSLLPAAPRQCNI